MNKDKLKVLVNFLYESQFPVTNKELSLLLDVSQRSITNYVKEINYNQDEKVIISTNDGYSLNKKQAEYYLTTSHTDLPSNHEERSMYIIKSILIKHNQINIFDLSEKIFVSYSTLKSDLNRMNKTFKSLKLEFITKNNVVFIEGDEKNKRRLVSYVMSEESSSGNLLNIDEIKNIFGDKDVETIEKLINHVVNKYNYYLNDFAFLNLLIHLIIVVRRIQEGHNVKQLKSLSIPKEDTSLISSLKCLIENNFNIVLSESEQYEVYLLFKTNANQSLSLPIEQLNTIVDRSLMSFTKELIKFINSHFYIDLMNQNFITPFVLHLKNLLLRIEQNISIRNPLIENIKLSVPSIYDIATVASLQINERYSTHLSEDEIAYLALHIGNEIERQKQDSQKIKVIIISPEYREISTNLQNKLLKNYDENLKVIANYSFESEISNINFDLIISTVPLSIKNKTTAIQISPFFTTIDQQIINEAIIDIQMKKKMKILRNNFDKYFSKNLFFISNSGRKRDDVLTKLTNSLEKNDYTDKLFQKHVFEREEASSTAFRKIAIPHSAKMEALKTGIAVVISHKGIEWSYNQKVNIVFLIAINKLDKIEFSLLYEALVDLFTNPSIVNSISNCKDFDEFRNLIFSMIN